MKREFSIKLNGDWCKGCGICSSFCPVATLEIAANGKIRVVDEKKCIGCRTCETRCPDFAIEIVEAS